MAAILRCSVRQTLTGGGWTWRNQVTVPPNGRQGGLRQASAAIPCDLAAGPRVSGATGAIARRSGTRADDQVHFAVQRLQEAQHLIQGLAVVGRVDQAVELGR